MNFCPNGLEFSAAFSDDLFTECIGISTLLLGQKNNPADRFSIVTNFDIFCRVPNIAKTDFSIQKKILVCCKTQTYLLPISNHILFLKSWIKSRV